MAEEQSLPEEFENKTLNAVARLRDAILIGDKETLFNFVQVHNSLIMAAMALVAAEQNALLDEVRRLRKKLADGFTQAAQNDTAAREALAAAEKQGYAQAVRAIGDDTVRLDMLEKLCFTKGHISITTSSHTVYYGNTLREAIDNAVNGEGI